MKTKRKNTVWSKEDCILLEELYIIQKLPVAEIATIFNTNKDAIWRKTESLGLARKVKYGVDHFYFSKMDTISKWYVLGMLSADGFLDSKNNRVGINLQIRDIAVLEFIKKELKFQGNILIKKASIVKGTGNLSQEQAYMKFTSSQITRDLIALGVTDRKSLTLEFPNIPDKFISSYLLGYFDGDGCLSGRTFTLLGTEDVCENFERKIRQLAKVDKVKIYKRNKQKKHYLRTDL